MVPLLRGLDPFQIALGRARPGALRARIRPPAGQQPGHGEAGSSALNDRDRTHSLVRCQGDVAAAYYDTAEALGFLVEVVEPPTAMPPTDFTL